ENSCNLLDGENSSIPPSGAWISTFTDHPIRSRQYVGRSVARLAVRWARRIIPLPLLLLWHHGGVMAGNEPLRTIPAIRITIAATDYCACLGERKCIEASINGGIAADLYEAQINLSGGTIL